MRRHVLKDMGENQNFDHVEAALSDNREDNSAAVDTDSDKSLYRDRKTGKRQVSHTVQGNSQRSDIQEHYKSIKDAIQRVKIPPELKVDDPRKGVKRQEQGKAAIIPACAGYGETLLKLLLTLEPEKPLKEGDLDDLLTIISAQLRYLQEEHALVLVNSSLGEGVGGCTETSETTPPCSLRQPLIHCNQWSPCTTPQISILKATAAEAGVHTDAKIIGDLTETTAVGFVVDRHSSTAT